ncbi:MAG: hypothetical protein ASARMPRED_008539 [Alectoria sarmentosa]|nr:MAG: hypothetical protein ASARMPRED_008539 [Alectoria sarmentosa]
MAHFASLPNELICEILKLVQPEDLENFAQSSRNVLRLAFPFLAEHRALIRKYSTLRNNKSPDSIENILTTIIANPCLGSYVKKVELGPLMASKIEADSANEYTKERLETFTTAALESECLKRPSEEEVLDEREFWSDAIKDGDEDILLAILLPLLPNLAALSVEAKSTRLNCKWYHSAVEQAASATKPTLCNLTHVQLNPRGAHGYDLAEIQRFSALPSVRVVSAPRAKGMCCLDELSPDANSNVTHLKLWESCIESKGLHEFLRGFPKLQSLTYSFIDTVYGCPHDAFLIRSSLLAHCKATLQSLTLLAPGCRNMSFMGSLRGFEALKEVYTEWSCFINQAPESRGPQLNDHLPISLVWLKIHDSKGRTKPRYEKVIKSAQYAREHRLQKLKWLIFGGFRVQLTLETVDQGLKKTCLNMGINLIFSPYAPKSGD